MTPRLFESWQFTTATYNMEHRGMKRVKGSTMQMVCNNNCTDFIETKRRGLGVVIDWVHSDAVPGFTA